MRYRPRLLHAFILLGAVLTGTWLVVVNLDPQTLKAAAVARVKAATGRTLTIAGDLQLAYWPKLSLRVEQLELENAPGFDARPMLALDTLEVAVGIFPLLRGELELDTLRLSGLTVNLERRNDGSTNWDDLVAQKKTPGENDALGKLAALALGGVDITGTELHWIDGLAGREAHLTAASLQSAPLAFGEPVEFSLKGELAASQPALSGPVEMRGTALYDPVKRRYSVTPLGFEARLSGKKLPGGRATLKGSSKVKLDPGRQRLLVDALSLEGLGHSLTGTLAFDLPRAGFPAIEGKLALRGQDLASLLRVLELPVAERVASLASRTSNIDSEFKFEPAAGALSLTSLKGQLLGVQISAQGEAAELDGDRARFEGAMELSGNDLPGLILVLNQLRNPTAPTRGALAKAMGKAGDRRFALKTRLKGDLGNNELKLPQLTLEAFGTTTRLSTGDDLPSPQAVTTLQGTLDSRGRDLTPLVLAGGSLQGLDEDSLGALAALMAGRKSRAYELTTALGLDLFERHLQLQALQGSVLGNQLQGGLAVASASGLSGDLSLQGPDLPALLGLVGALSASPAAIETARRLATAKDQSFTTELRLKRDPSARRLELAPLRASAFGLSLNAQFQMTNPGVDGAGKVKGKLALEGQDLQPLFAALDYPLFAGRVDTLSLEAAVDGSTRALTLAPSALRVKLHPLGDSAPAELSLSSGKGSANLETGTFTLDQIVLAGPGLSGTGGFRRFARAGGEPGYESNLKLPPFNLRRLLMTLGQPAPETRDARALTKVGLQARTEGDAVRHALKGMVLTIDETTMKADLMLETGATPGIDFTLSVDKLDADRYLGANKEGKADVITPEVVALGAMRLPKARLRALHINGQANCGTLQYAGARLSDLDLRLKAEAGKLALAPVKAQLYGGRYQGEFLLDVRDETPILDSNTTLAKINLEPLLTDVADSKDLAGVLNFEARLSMRGNDTRQQLASLNGPASFAITDGELRGLDLPAVLRAAEITLESKRPQLPPTGGSTRFRSVTGSLNVEKGVVRNRDLLMEGEGFQITGEGVLADLPRTQMDYVARLRVPPASGETQGHRYNLGDYEIPIRCRGPLAVKSCTPDLAGLAGKATGQALQKGVEKLIEEKAGGAGKAIKKLLEF
ncbi:MAG: AsmA family protein [Gammaproteobacteria bacterium]|nr:AsmA family protein [Gammaproteobacteria bacterium]